MIIKMDLFFKIYKEQYLVIKNMKIKRIIFHIFNNDANNDCIFSNLKYNNNIT